MDTKATRARVGNKVACLVRRGEQGEGGDVRPRRRRKDGAWSATRRCCHDLVI